AVLPLATIALYIPIKRDWALLGKMKIFSGGALFLAIAAPWFIAVSLANDEFLRFFFIQEHFQRFTTEMHGRAHPAWYFLPILAASYASYIPWLVAAGIWLAVTSVAAWRRSIAACVGLLALGGFGATQIALIGHRTLAAEFSVAPTIAALPALPPASARVFTVDAYDHTIPWSLRRTVTMVGSKDELGEAIRWEPQKFIPDLPGFARAWSAAPEAY